MSHLGDTNKMVSDTPISDSTPHNVGDLGMLCRRLERELAAANAEIEEKRKDVVWLATEKAKLENYVMRLEEAGSEAICPIEYATRVRIWNKAKEAKL